MSIDYAERIPNNVELGSNRTLQRALEQWQPAFLSWWKEMGPTDFNAADVYLRTAISVDAKGWANYDYVRMPDYRWGIFLAEPEHDRRAGFGDDFGEPGMATGAGRASQHAAAADRHAGRYRTGLGRTAASARPHARRRSTTCATCFR